jgi:hypothetical protein
MVEQVHNPAEAGVVLPIMGAQVVLALLVKLL